MLFRSNSPPFLPPNPTTTAPPGGRDLGASAHTKCHIQRQEPFPGRGQGVGRAGSIPHSVPGSLCDLKQVTQKGHCPAWASPTPALTSCDQEGQQGGAWKPPAQAGVLRTCPSLPPGPLATTAPDTMGRGGAHPPRSPAPSTPPGREAPGGPQSWSAGFPAAPLSSSRSEGQCRPPGA